LPHGDLAYRASTDGFPQEIFYTFPMEDSVVNGTHIFIEFAKPLRGEFVRESPVLNSHEYGKVEHRWCDNPMSTFPGVIVGGAERLHTLSHDGPWPTASLDRARDEQASRWPHTNWLAKKMRRAKTMATFLFLLSSKSADQWVNAAVDPNHVAKLAEFVEQHGGQPESSLVDREHALLRKLVEQSSKSASRRPSSSSSDCFHLGVNPGLQMTSTGVYVPLGRKLFSYKGDIMSSPLGYFHVASGTSTFRYDSSKGVLNIYFGASSLFRFADPQGPAPNPKVFIGPADGASFTVAEEGRVQEVGPSHIMHGLYNAAHRIPLDYDYLFSDPQKLCPPEKFNRLAEEAKDMDLMVFRGEEKPSLVYQVQLMNHLVDVMDCGTPFLRAKQQNGNGVGLLETIVWAHFLMESTPTLRLQNVHDWEQ